MSVPSCHTKTVIYSQCLTASPRNPSCLGWQSVGARSRYCISLHPTPTQLTKPCCRRYPAQECRHAVVGKRLQSLRAVEMMIHAVQTNTFRMPTMWKKWMNTGLRKMGSAFGVICCREQGIRNWGDLNKLRSDMITLFRYDLTRKNFGSHSHFRTNFIREMGPDNNGMNTLFRSPLVVRCVHHQFSSK